MEPSAATNEPTFTSEPTASDEPAPVVVKSKLELKLTVDEFEAEKENYIEAFATSAGVDKSSVSMYLASSDVPQGDARRALGKRELLEALEVICDVITSNPEQVEDAVVADDFVQHFNEQLSEPVLERVAEVVTITEAPTVAASDSANTATSDSNGGGQLTAMLISVAIVLALCAVCGLYAMRGWAPKVVLQKGSSLISVLPQDSLDFKYDEREGDVETSNWKRDPSTASNRSNNRVSIHSEGWSKELYDDIVREGETQTGSRQPQNKAAETETGSRQPQKKAAAGYIDNVIANVL